MPPSYSTSCANGWGARVTPRSPISVDCSPCPSVSTRPRGNVVITSTRYGRPTHPAQGRGDTSGGDGEHFVEACEKALVEHVEIGDSAAVDVDTQRTGVDVGEQRDIDGRADRRTERVLHPNSGTAEENRHRDVRDIACDEVDVTQDRTDVPAWHQVERPCNPLGIGQRPLT